jgi:hypothetical protein
VARVAEIENMLIEKFDTPVFFFSERRGIETCPANARVTSMPDGYFMRLTSKDSTQVHVDIFVPEESDPGRVPQAIKPKKIFRPSRWVGLPAQGQRLAISTKTIPRPKRDHKNLCNINRDHRPKHCHEMTDQDRKRKQKLRMNIRL